jgi:hypothetical protein
MISPCKKCINHSRIFPVCFDKCKSIEQFQHSLFHTSIIEEAEDYEYITQDCLWKYEGIYRLANTKTPQIEAQLY